MTVPSGTSDASGRPGASGSERTGPHPVADVFLALLLLGADAVVALVAYLWSMNAAGFAFFGGDNTDVSFTPVAVTLAVVSAVFLGTAFLAGRGKAYVTAVVQVVAGLTLLLASVLGQAEESRQDHPPAPEPGYSGPHSQCLSGGDNSECNGS
ncbi:hypothetical protein GCM10027074_57430 [Streptomyces deserti]